MKEKILSLEKSLFNIKYMNDYDYLNKVIDDEYLELGKSGRFFNKIDVINDLLNQKENRNIKIENYEFKKIDNNTYLIHYITNDIYRTSIWINNNGLKIIFHQASKLKGSD